VVGFATNARHSNTTTQTAPIAASKYSICHLPRSWHRG
jgi:hypothetical protein